MTATKTVKVNYHYKKIVDYEGHINIPLDELKDAKEIVECQYDNPEDGEVYESDWSDLQYAGASCAGCGVELDKAEDVHFFDNDDMQFCRTCKEED